LPPLGSLVKMNSGAEVMKWLIKFLVQFLDLSWKTNKHQVQEL